ncbi:hypothetical protein [Bauldia sp.]|uniref:hypothetical protein n=1 Tax=Bauldia sp. TaxID=2575872 RepID=UPI003BAACA36
MNRTAIAACLFVAAATQATAEDIPDLIGTWNIEMSAIGHRHPVDQRAEQPRILFEGSTAAVIDWQEGVLFSGRDVLEDVPDGFDRVDGELLSGVIGADNTTVFMVDDNGTITCTLISPNQMNCIYGHIEESASVAAIVNWTREN